MRISSLGAELFDMIEVTVRGKFKVEKQEFLNYVETIDSINSLPESKSSIDGEDLNDYEVPEILELLVMPSAVKAANHQFARDLLVKPVLEPKNGSKILDPHSFNRISLGIQTGLKGNNLIPVNNLRTVAYLSDVFERIVVEESVVSPTNGVFQLPLHTNVPFSVDDMFAAIPVDKAMLQMFKQMVQVNGTRPRPSDQEMG